MGRYSGKSCRLITMIVMTSGFFLVELIVGHITGSLALVGDAYHMLSDIISLIVGLTAVKISKLTSKRNTFGWARAEVLGALINAVFLLVLSLTVTISAIERFVTIEEVENPDLILIVGGIGLLINLIGMALFHKHGHSHGGMSHSHGDHGHSHDDHGHSHGDHGHAHDDHELKKGQTTSKNIHIEMGETAQNVKYSNAYCEDVTPAHEEPKQKAKVESGAQMNMKGVFLHVAGDALGSVAVMVSALLIKYLKSDYKYLADPILSLLIVVIICAGTIPLFIQSSKILLQTAPSHISTQELSTRLVDEVEGLIAIHEFHVWQLSGERIIASAHVQCDSSVNSMVIAEKIKQFFHKEGIHATTVQQEYIGSEASEKTCLLECGADKDCLEKSCCPPDNGVKKRKGKSHSNDISLGDEV